VALFELDAAECTRLLARLDRLKFIELMPNNRIRLLVSRAFAWIPDGPIQRFFKAQGVGDFFRSSFDGEHELMVLANGALSKPSVGALLARLRKTAAEFSAPRCRRASARRLPCCWRRGRGCRISCGSTGARSPQPKARTDPISLRCEKWGRSLFKGARRCGGCRYRPGRRGSGRYGAS
jgi:hypothetical protein